MNELKIKSKYDYTFEELKELSRIKYMLDLKLHRGLPFLKIYDGIGDEYSVDEDDE
tara:strand:- start:273 stop:440 length:168 start_codon:yes stop_codon:yes gene_type:complete